MPILKEPKVPMRFPPARGRSSSPRLTFFAPAHSLVEARYSQDRGIELAGLPVTAICIERMTNLGTFPWSPRRFAAKVSHNTRTGGKDGFWRGDVLHRLFDDPGGARPGAGGTRLRVGVGARTLAHPQHAQNIACIGRRAREALLRRDGPVRHTDGDGVATKTLKVGTGVCLVIQRDTIQTAKLV